MSSPTNGISCLHLVLADSVVMQEAMQTLFHSNPGFINANTSTGQSPLAFICTDCPWASEKIRFLLERNADVTERDSDGRTCLHLCVSLVRDALVWTFDLHRMMKQYSMGIIVLIKHGADVYAKDHDGRSVSDVAYAAQPWDYTGELGSVQGDVWDFALASCGYDILTFRQGRRRKARHGKRYRRQDFEKLWEGQEHLCPYYYDEENYLSDEDSEACSDEGSEDGWATTDSEEEG